MIEREGGERARERERERERERQRETERERKGNQRVYDIFLVDL